MSQRGMELTVGVFVLAGLAALAYLSIRLGGLDLFETGTYEVSARFSSASGLREGATVEIAGVQVGRVKAIRLEQNEALLTLRLHSPVRLTEDTIASVRTKGILGDKYISISLGGAEKTIAPGGRIRETEPPVDIEKLIGQFIYGKVK
ncbi:MAG: outer membrane lipid asymmetry maintenance protein MlaD [Nitrospinota bacterium]